MRIENQELGLKRSWNDLQGAGLAWFRNVNLRPWFKARDGQVGGALVCAALRRIQAGCDPEGTDSRMSAKAGGHPARMSTDAQITAVQ